eukprot:1147398-Pelagomonas_calceolata.AAC.1
MKGGFYFGCIVRCVRNVAFTKQTQQLARHKRGEKTDKKKAGSVPQALKLARGKLKRDTGNTKRWRRETEIQKNTQGDLQPDGSADQPVAGPRQPTANPEAQI